MLIGRERRKFTSQAIAFIAFRWIGVWLLIAISAGRGPNGELACSIIIAVDIIAGGLARALPYYFDEMERKNWHLSLTHRVFYRLLADRVRDAGAGAVDVEDLFRVASTEASDDILKADTEHREEAGLFDKAAWHWFGGVIHFLVLTASFALYYGSAIYFGQSAHI